MILHQPYHTPYGASEITAIQDFVGSGGGLLIHGDGGGNSNSYVANLNQLVAEWGVVYASSPGDGSGHSITNFVAHPVTDGLAVIGVDYQRPLVSIQSPALDLTVGSGSDDALAAVDGGGNSGNVVLLSDTSMWKDDDEGADTPLSYGDNQLLLENIIPFIVQDAGGDGGPAVPATSGIGVGLLVLLLGGGSVYFLRRR